MQKILKIGLFGLLLSAYSLCFAQVFSHPVIDRLIAQNSEPEGIVFELVAYDRHAWSWAAPKISQLSAQLKAKYPKVDIAIISHGNEQFQLSVKNAKKNQHSTALLSKLVKDGVDIYVCGVNSLWNNVPENSYIEEVSVATSGPAKINDYINLGYTLIKLNK
ncbi:DsrE family protein [Candidatus Thioglobus sp.]|uniref:DsrE family protein n=1 Tax=Candidatus Thioglobus sp. TaxID=2026721 RepID=UPI003D133BB6